MRREGTHEVSAGPVRGRATGEDNPSQAVDNAGLAGLPEQTCGGVGSGLRLPQEPPVGAGTSFCGTQGDHAEEVAAPADGLRAGTGCKAALRESEGLAGADLAAIFGQVRPQVSSEVRPSRTASFVNSATLWTSSFVMMWRRWVSAVFTLTWS